MPDKGYDKGKLSRLLKKAEKLRDVLNAITEFKRSDSYYLPPRKIEHLLRRAALANQYLLSDLIEVLGADLHWRRAKSPPEVATIRDVVLFFERQNTFSSHRTAFPQIKSMQWRLTNSISNIRLTMSSSISGVSESSQGLEPPVRLGKPREPVFVLGKEKPHLTAARHAVIKALLWAWEQRRGLNKDELDDKSQHESAHKILYRLCAKDKDWAQVIDLPKGHWGEGYRLRFPS